MSDGVASDKYGYNTGPCNEQRYITLIDSNSHSFPESSLGTRLSAATPSLYMNTCMSARPPATSLKSPAVKVCQSGQNCIQALIEEFRNILREKSQNGIPISLKQRILPPIPAV